jgi:RNA polymerase sigma-70 factor, ECF subfamily
MKRINLKELYPFYQSDCFISVSDDVAGFLRKFEKTEHAAYERRRAYKAYYSLDTDDGIEDDIIVIDLSPCELYERKATYRELYAAINCLPDKQAKRIFAYYFLELSESQIARIEGVDQSTVAHSIKDGVSRLKILLKFVD